jgi:hypothetical protein
MELQDALAKISEIRAQIARTETFRGYRSITVGFSGLTALAAAAVQAVWLPEPGDHMTAYLTLWVAAAVVSLAATGIEMTVRCNRATSPWTARLTWMAVEQFLPCVLAGGLLTSVMVLYAPESLWMLPGLWSILFSLGIFASCRLLPRPIFWVAAYYLLGGGVCLAAGHAEAAFSPWAMAGTFGVGQLIIAAILYYTLEQTDE